MTGYHALPPAGRIKMPIVMLLCQLIIICMGGHVTRSDCEGLKKSAVCPVHWMGPMMIHCGMTVKKED
jgi:hypothetical protein